MATGPDLFVVCKNCGAEVSPYITECPYCGTRLRKRAPKIERDGTISEPRARRRRGSRPARTPRKLPGIGAPAYGARPWATIVLVALSLALWVALIWIADFRVIPVSLDVSPERLLYGVFAYFNGWYQLAVLTAVGLYGWLLERRHGAPVVVALFVLGGIGGLAAAVAVDGPAVGANGAALALLCAWAMRDGMAARRGEDYEGDLLGTAVISAVVFLMPAFVEQASWVAGGVGVLVGALAGLFLARAEER